MAKVSIILPIYNTEEYITECINSLLSQTYKNIEIIIIDDHSDLECKRLIQEIAAQDPRIKVFHLDENMGVGFARNFGITKASGELIYFVDSDDYVAPTTIELLTKNINNYDMICGKIEHTYTSGSKVEQLEGLSKPAIYTDNRFNLIKNSSALNWLIKKDFINNNRLVFSEEVVSFSDLNFMVPALYNNKEIPYLKEALYFKRERNDPILKPSIMQGDSKRIIEDFLNIFIVMKEYYKEDTLINDYLDFQILDFYSNAIVEYFKDESEITSIFKFLNNALDKVQHESMKSYGYFIKKEIQTIIKGDSNKFIKLNSKHHFLREFKIAIRGRRKLYIFLYNRFFTKLPVKKNMIFLESFLGKSYSDNPKYIYEYMKNNSDQYKYVWSFNEKKGIPGNPKQVKRFSLKYFYYLATAKYWISNSRLPKDLKKREETTYLQTWHGTPLKKLVFDMKDIYSADPNYKYNFYKQSRRWDYLNSANQYSSEIFRRAFLYDGEMLEYGYPRNDILYQKNNEKDIKQIKDKLKLPSNKKVILYAPTWRDDEFYGSGRYKFNLKLELERLQKELGENYIVILRMHYFIANQMDISQYQGFAYDYSKYDDIAELYLVSDILITDYSSVFFDYANLQRPILFYTYDLEKYRDTLRGFYINIEEEVPGPLLKDTDEIVESIKNINQIEDQYKDKYKRFYNRFCQWDDGRASELTVRAVFKDFK